MMASRTGNVEAMKVLLDRGADVNAKEALRGTTALMWAAAETHPAAVQLLVEHGANVSARSNPAPRGKAPYVSLGQRRPAPAATGGGQSADNGQSATQTATQGAQPQRPNPEQDL